MIYYIDMKAGETPINLAVDAVSFSVAATIASAWGAGYMTGQGSPEIILESIVTGKRPRGKTYFNAFDADAIRRGLKL